MAEKSGFFNSVNGDRKYKADFFAEYFASFIGNGVFPNPSNALQVIASTNMNIIVKAGKAWINGYYYNNDADLTLTLDTADGVLNRIDKIVLQFNTLSRTISVKIKKGTFASNAVAPALQRDSNAYELALADVYIPKGSINILQSNITDIRLDSGRCGIVHGTVDQVDTTTLFNQYQTWLNEKKTSYDTDMVAWTTQKKSDYESWYNATIEAEKSEIDAMEAQFQDDFDTWFASVKSVLDDNTIGNLNNKIDAIPKVFRGTDAPAAPAAIDIWFQELGNGNVQINERNADNTAWVEVFTKTKAGNVMTNAGLDMEAQLADLQKIQTAGGTATAITLTNVSLTDGFTKTFIVSANNSAVATTINGKPLYKPNTANPPNLTKGKAVTIWYDLAKAAFFFKASAEGNTIAAHVLAGDSFSNDEDTNIIGTMPNNGALNKTLPINGSYVIPAGYTSGGAVTQSIPTKAAATIIPTTSDQTIGANQYLTGTQTIKGDINLVPANIVNGKKLFNVTGTATAKSLGGYVAGDILTNNEVEKRIEDAWSFSARGTARTDSMVYCNGYIYVVAGVNDGYISKVDKNGTEFSYFTGFYTCNIAPLTNSDVFILGKGNGASPYLYKKNSTGTNYWYISSSSAQLGHIATDDTNVYFGVGTGGTVYKYNGTGTYVWAKTHGTTTVADVYYKNGYIYFFDTAHIIRKMDTGGNLIWACTTTVNIQDLAIDNDGNVYAAAVDRILKIDSNGVLAWTIYVTSAINIAVDNTGYIYVGTGNNVLAIIAFNPSGNMLWSKPQLYSTVYDIECDDENNIYYGIYQRNYYKLKHYYYVAR